MNSIFELIPGKIILGAWPTPPRSLCPGGAPRGGWKKSEGLFPAPEADPVDAVLFLGARLKGGGTGKIRGRTGIGENGNGKKEERFGEWILAV